ncbi:MULTISPECIES: WXG100 family type VII secretion target [Nocardia]|uniref:WXG100 family type VII secretion target n=1 Tax=Nocardia implantans TaxID=3108168 RepID=A0ABU6B1Z2_9NOCA|nr:MULTISPECIES: WXG100 family type VII secretion target [unclassified Nocardia]MBF6194976.1 WXG100 family type VII secretion target [Nocardia beijingensis]MEA3530363.1 WXG100 family type VII secretion target [Nocardia sp. CDC192]MEB3513777.1 WXG100 family type VII secretion target [Nocardia sp. CDC186]
MREMPRAGERATHRRTDPAYAPNVEVFDNLTHDEIHAKVQLLNPAVLAGGRQAWSDAAANLADAVFQAHAEIRAAIADGWRGSAAKSADAVVRVFEQGGQDLADVFAVVSQRLGQASDAAEALRAAVNEPPTGAPDLGAALLDPSRATSNVEGQKASEHARQDVVRAMNDIYAGVFARTGTDVPAFPDESDQPAAPAPTATPTSKIAGTIPVASEAPSTSSGTYAPKPIHAVEHGVLATPADPTPSSEAPATSPAAAAAPTTTAATVADVAPAPNAPRLVSAATAALPTVAAASVLPTAPAAGAPGPATAPASVTSEPVTVPAVPGVGGQVPPEEQRKRDERRKNDDGSDAAVTGLGAGAVGGLMGGAVAAADTPRSGSSVAANAASARLAPIDDEDDEFDLDDLPTFLEPSDDGGELIGSLDPTTPPVLGEWTEYE